MLLQHKPNLPWDIAKLPVIADILDARRIPVNASQRAQRPGAVPYYGATGQVGVIDKPLFDEELVLLGEDGAPFLDPLKSKAYIIRGPSWVNNHAHVLRARSGFDNRFLCHYLNSVSYERYVNGTTRLKLTQAAMREIPIPVPPLAQQREIVAFIDEQFSRLDAADRFLESAEQNLAALSYQDPEVAWDEAWPAAPLRAVLVDALLGLDRGRTKQNIPGSNCGYVKMNNVSTDGRVALDDLVYVRATESEVERYSLADGDILFNTRNSRELVGKTGIVRGPAPRTLFNNNLLRLRFRDTTTAAFVGEQFRSEKVRSALERAKNGTTNVAAIYARDLMPILFRIPPAEVMVSVVQELERRTTVRDRLFAAISEARIRYSRLRRNVLDEMFAGRLAAYNRSQEVIDP